MESSISASKVVLSLLAIGVAALIVAGSYSSRRLGRYFALFIAATVVVSCGIGLYYVRPWMPMDDPIVIARVQTGQDGNVQLVQYFRGWTGLYDVELRHAFEGSKRRYYIAHEDLFWPNATLELDESGRIVTVEKQGATYGKLYLTEGVFVHLTGNKNVQRTAIE